MTKDLYPENNKNSYNSLMVNKHSINNLKKKQAKELNTNTSQKKIYEETISHMKKYSLSLVTREI